MLRYIYDSIFVISPFFYFQFFRLRVDTPHRVMVDWIMNDSFMGQLRMLIYHICPFTLWLQYTSNNCMLKLGRCLLLFLNVRVIMNSTSQSITTIQTMCDDDDRSCAQICFCFRIPKIITSIVLFHCSGVYSSTSIDLDLGLVCIYIYIYIYTLAWWWIHMYSQLCMSLLIERVRSIFFFSYINKL